MTTASLPGPAANTAPEAVAERVERARQAQAVWRRYSLSQRVQRLRAFWKELTAAKGRLLEVMHDETGKPLPEIQAMEISAVELILKYFTGNAHRILKDQAAWKPWILFNKRAYVRYVPRGVVGLITPWNFPFLIPFGDAIPALLAGNAVVIKPSEWTTRTALFLESAFKASGLFPEDLLQVVPGDGAVGAKVLDAVDMVLFTGSTRSGRAVAQAAAAQLKPAVMELGGLHPMIVLRDAPMGRAVQAALWGRFANCGQVCVGVERVLVEAPAYEEFSKALVAGAAALRQGISKGFDVDVGRLIFPKQLDVVLDHLADARVKGARVFGGEVVDKDRLLVSPAVVLDATLEMKVMREETFGPVLPVMAVRSAEEAVRVANDTPYGLAASVWSRDLPAAEALSAHLEAGMVGVNDLGSHYAVCALPFGGFKQSGLGRRHSDEGLRMFCQPQSVLAHEFPADQPELWWFPYDESKAKILSWLSRLA